MIAKNTALYDTNSDTKRDTKEILKSLQDFRDSLHSVCLATLDKDTKTLVSYAPYIRCEGKNYIYISEVAEHFKSIRANPKNIEVMFLQDEAAAISPIRRVRLRYRAEASFVARDSDEFKSVLERFERDISEIKLIRNMRDFHLVRLDFKKGRFVMGFGAAWEVVGDSIVPIQTTTHKF